MMISVCMHFILFTYISYYDCFTLLITIYFFNKITENDICVQVFFVYSI